MEQSLMKGLDKLNLVQQIEFRGKFDRLHKPMGQHCPRVKGWLSIISLHGP